MSDRARHAWGSEGYVAEWVGQDALADMLALPRQLSAALVVDAGTAVGRVIDLGSGPGAYLRVLLDAFPGAEGVWVDSSEPMEEIARAELAELGDRVTFVRGDAARPGQLDLGAADVVTTSRMVHHFSPDAIRDLYGVVRTMLNPGGFFFNLDHYGCPDDWEQRYRNVRGKFTGRSDSDKKRHPHEYPFTRLDEHLQWLSDADFDTPDVPWRTFFTALVAAAVPA